MNFLGIMNMVANAKNSDTTSTPFTVPPGTAKLRFLTAQADVSLEVKKDTAAAPSALATTAAAGYLLPANTAVDVPVDQDMRSRIVVCCFAAGTSSCRVWALYA